MLKLTSLKLDSITSTVLILDVMSGKKVIRFGGKDKGWKKDANSPCQSTKISQITFQSNTILMLLSTT